MKIRALLVLLVLMMTVSAAYPQAERTPTHDPNAPAPAPTPGEIIYDKKTVNDVDETEVVKVSTDVVSIPVSVLDRKGRYIFDLKRDEFQIFEDGKQQQIEFFAATDQPFTVVLMLDISLSTRFQIHDIQRAAAAFIDQLRPQDKMMIVAFAEDVYVLSEFTGDRETLKRSIQSTRFKEGTSLYDAFDFVVTQRMAGQPGRKAILLFSDGVDTTSRKGTFEKNLAATEELDSLIYTINYDTYADIKKMDREESDTIPPEPVNISPLPPPVVISTGRERRSSADTAGRSNEEAKLPGLTAKDYKRAKFYLESLSELTGGRLMQAETLNDLEGAFSTIAQELRQQYSIGYYPPDEENRDRSRTVKVKVTRPKLIVKARDTYTLGEKKALTETKSGKPSFKKRN